MSKLFITGIGGFIGRHVAAEAARNGYDVSGTDIASLKIEGAEVVKCDIRNRDRMLKLTKDADHIIHLAGVTVNAEFNKRLVYSYDINVNGFLSVINAAHENGCGRFMYASTSALYDRDFSEDAKIIVARLRSHYARTKMINEMIASSYNEAYKMETIGVRPFQVYGPGENQKGDYASHITLFVRMIKQGKPIVLYGDGTQARDFIYIDDVARVMLLLLKRATPGVYNIGTGVSTSFNKIAALLDKKAVRRVPNPIANQAYLTRADMRKTLGVIGGYKFLSVEKGIKLLMMSRAPV